MPFRSKAQRKWMYANKPDLPDEFESETPRGEKLPKRVQQKKKRTQKGTHTAKVSSNAKGGAWVPQYSSRDNHFSFGL